MIPAKACFGLKVRLFAKNWLVASVPQLDDVKKIMISQMKRILYAQVARNRQSGSGDAMGFFSNAKAVMPRSIAAIKKGRGLRRKVPNAPSRTATEYSKDVGGDTDLFWGVVSIHVVDTPKILIESLVNE